MKILTYPNDLLTWPTCMVVDFDDNLLRELAESMIQTLKIEGGLGLAANQVGSDLDFFVYKEGDDFFTAINPRIVGIGEPELMDEGCLSLPGIRAQIPRHTHVIMTYDDMDDNKHHVRNSDGQLAQVFQHEIDHLNGKLMWDNLSSLNRDILKRRYKKVNKRRKS